MKLIKEIFKKNDKIVKHCGIIICIDPDDNKARFWGMEFPSLDKAKEEIDELTRQVLESQIDLDLGKSILEKFGIIDINKN